MRKVFTAVLALAAVAICLMLSIATANGDTLAAPEGYRVIPHTVVRIAYPPPAPVYAVQYQRYAPVLSYPATMYTPILQPAVVAQPVNVSNYRMQYWTPLRNALFGRYRTVVSPAPIFAVPQRE